MKFLIDIDKGRRISTDGFTEKLSPCACPGSWYGSCPRITTFTFESGVNAKALKMSSGAGVDFLCLVLALYGLV